MGTHFFSPANVMKLLENVRGAKTNDLTISSMMAWGKRIGKWVILVGNCPGFVGNRMVALYNGQARAMVLEGATPSQVDEAATKFGMKMGPLAMSDLVGLDLGIQAVKKRGDYKPATVLPHALIESGRLGQKTAAGYFDYDKKTGKSSASPTAEKIIEGVRANVGGKTRTFTEEEIVQRIMYPLMNEGFDILVEGFAEKPGDVDVCFVHGYSFPRPRGGPMFYADTLGLPKLKAGLEKMGMPVSSLLADCVAANMTLAAYWEKNGAHIRKNPQPTGAIKASL
jgi:3-hydroxyacyl-CoA dehydrogenase